LNVPYVLLDYWI